MSSTNTTTDCTGHWLTPRTFDRVPGEWNTFLRFNVELLPCSGCGDVWAIVRDEDCCHAPRTGSYTFTPATVADMGGLSETLARFAVANCEASGQVGY